MCVCLSAGLSTWVQVPLEARGSEIPLGLGLDAVVSQPNS